MPLTDEERKAIVGYRLEKSCDALVEAKDCASMGHWNLAETGYTMLPIMLHRHY